MQTRIISVTQFPTRYGYPARVEDVFAGIGAGENTYYVY